MVVAVALVGCGAAVNPRPSDDAPWKGSASAVTVTPAPDAGGVLSFRNCPTLGEARAAMPAITDGPNANAVPFKTMVLQCRYGLPDRDAQGRPAEIDVLVFDSIEDGRATWRWELERDWGSPTVLPDLGEEAFATHGSGQWDVWVSDGRFGLHLLHTSRHDLGLDQMRALAAATLVGLDRPAR